MSSLFHLSFRSWAAIGMVIVLPGAAVSPSTQAVPVPEPIVREVLATGSPVAAPGQELQLVRYVIQAGTRLSPHTHPGMQIAWIESGILRYVVVEGGELPVYRKSTAGRPGTVETLGPGQ